MHRLQRAGRRLHLGRRALAGTRHGPAHRPADGAHPGVPVPPRPRRPAEPARRRAGRDDGPAGAGHPVARRRRAGPRQPLGRRLGPPAHVVPRPARTAGSSCGAPSCRCGTRSCRRSPRRSGGRTWRWSRPGWPSSVAARSPSRPASSGRRRPACSRSPPPRSRRRRRPHDDRVRSRSSRRPRRSRNRESDDGRRRGRRPGGTRTPARRRPPCTDGPSTRTVRRTARTPQRGTHRPGTGAAQRDPAPATADTARRRRTHRHRPGERSATSPLGPPTRPRPTGRRRREAITEIGAGGTGAQPRRAPTATTHPTYARATDLEPTLRLVRGPTSSAGGAARRRAAGRS